MRTGWNRFRNVPGELLLPGLPFGLPAGAALPADPVQGVGREPFRSWSLHIYGAGPRN